MDSTNSLSELLPLFDLKEFLTQNKQTDAGTFLLRNKGNTNRLNWLLAEQLKIYPKAHHKLPSFTLNHCWLSTKSYEQCSSEASAKFKSTLFKGRKMLDLSGGLGVDDWAFSPSFDKIISLDPDTELNILVRENYKKLNLSNIERLDQTAETYLNEKSTEQFDLIFLDADRRVQNQRNYFLEQNAPNFLEIEKQCREMSQYILLKLSPMVDLSYVKKTIRGLERIIILGDKTEVKELLVLIGPKDSEVCQVEAVILGEENSIRSFSNHGSSEPKKSFSIEGLATYFFEPHPCIIKAELSKLYANYCGLNQLAVNSQYYFGEIVPEQFMGRSFKLIHSFEFSKSTLQKYLKSENLNQANISKRNFVLTVEEIRKAYKIKEGGKDYLFFTSLDNGTRMVYHGVKIT